MNNRNNYQRLKRCKKSITVRHMRRLAAQDNAIFLAELDTQLFSNNIRHSELHEQENIIGNESFRNVSENDVEASYNLDENRTSDNINSIYRENNIGENCYSDGIHFAEKKKMTKMWNLRSL